MDHQKFVAGLDYAPLFFLLEYYQKLIIFYCFVIMLHFSLLHTKCVLVPYAFLLNQLTVFFYHF